MYFAGKLCLFYKMREKIGILDLIFKGDKRSVDKKIK